jgi:hypothetical protein
MGHQIPEPAEVGKPAMQALFNANTQSAMKILANPSAVPVVCAPPACAREDATKPPYLPKEAKARINRFAHQEAERHGALVRDRMLASVNAMAKQGKPLRDLLAEVTRMISEPSGQPANAKDESRRT